MTEMYKKYMKYKMKYLHLINNIEGGEGTPTKNKRGFSGIGEPDYPKGWQQLVKNRIKVYNSL